MIRVLMFDLGETLVDAQRRPFAHVREALKTIGGFHAADGKPLRSCLVSDYTIVPPPVTSGKVGPVFTEYLALLDGTGLRSFFEPVDRRVTLSTHAGVLKPAAAIFEKALARLRVKAGLDECLLITENAAHVTVVRQKLGMQALQFRSSGTGAFDFEDWSQAPALIAQRVAGSAHDNLTAAVHAHLAARGVEVEQLQADGSPGSWAVAGRRWHPVVLPSFGTVHVALPVSGKIARGPEGELTAALPPVEDDEALEASNFARSLATQGQIARADAASVSTTHAIEVDPEGRQRLVRRRFKAI